MADEVLYSRIAWNLGEWKLRDRRRTQGPHSRMNRRANCGVRTRGGNMQGIYRTERDTERQQHLLTHSRQDLSGHGPARTKRSLQTLIHLIMLVASAVAVLLGGWTSTNAQRPPAAAEHKGCDPGNAGLTLPPGFCASIFADNLGRARHLTVAPNGDVYVNTWSSSYTGLKNAAGG